MQSQYGWNVPEAAGARAMGSRVSPWTTTAGGGPYAQTAYSYPATRAVQMPVRPQASSWAQSYVANEDYGNLVSQGYGPAWQSEHPLSVGSLGMGSPHSADAGSSACCSPPGPEGGWISPMDAQPVYLSPVLLQSHLTPATFGPGPFAHAPSQSSVSTDSEEDTICARSPDSASYFRQLPASHFNQGNVFEMDMDEPSTTTTAGDDEDGEEETTVDDADVWDDVFSDSLDTTIDYSYLRGAVESDLDIEDFDVQLNTSKTPCLDALAFCVVMRLGCYQTPQDVLDCSITITNFSKLLLGIHHFCPKKSQTANEEARIKALKRWFDGIPAKRKRDVTFVMGIKDPKNPVVHQIIKKLQKFCISKGYVKALDANTQNALRPMG